MVGGADPLPERLAGLLGDAAATVALHRGPSPAVLPPHDALLYLALSRAGTGSTPDLADAEDVLRGALAAGARRILMVSSTAAGFPSHRHAGMLDEDRLAAAPPLGSIAARWRALEDLAAQLAGDRLTVLRACPVPLAGGRDFWSRLLTRRLPSVVWGYDPPLQFLSLEDLAAAVAAALKASRPGLYHVAPSSAVPLRAALHRAGGRRLPLPVSLQRAGRAALHPLGLAASFDELAYARYPWTVDGSRAARELGFRPRHGSAEALARNLGRPPAAGEPASDDPFGLDRAYVRRLGRTLFRFLHDVYWRVEYRGLEHVPRSGAGVLVGVHRGFQPWDGVMILHLLARELGRFPRFLLHPALVKFPFLAPYLMKLGGVLACRENADWVLARGHLLGIFPEGIRGAFSLYRDAYRLKRFGRDQFVRIALRHGAPIVPFVTVGSAETFPIVAKVRWRWWQRWSEWPCLPVTPPLPLPAKWHTLFLEPLPTAGHPPESTGDRALVAEIGAEVRGRLQAALDDLRRRRRSIFFGSIFEDGKR